MSEETEEGAIATVRYFIEAVNMAYATNDPSYFENLATDDCGSCGDIAETIRTAREQKQAFEDYELVLGEIEKSGPMDEGWFAVKADVTQDRLLVRNSDGSVSSREPAPTRTSTVFVLDFTDGQWLLKGFVV